LDQKLNFDLTRLP